MRTVKIACFAAAMAALGLLISVPNAHADGRNDGRSFFGISTLYALPDTTASCTDPLNPDTDGDGCTDGQEVKVMDTDPRKVDTDGDGLGDCEEVNKYKTDPTKRDTDNDGCTDYDEIFKLKTNPRNPDSDGDGVLDCQDACPLVPGTKENRGCPGRRGTPTPPPVPNAPMPPARKRLTMRHTYFIVNTANFNNNKRSADGRGPKDDLDSLYNYLQQCDEVRVWIEGHTSAEGSAKRNAYLSQARADAVKNEMIRRGVDPKKIVGTRGFASQYPEQAEPDPKSKKGRAKKGSAAYKELEAIRENNRRMTVAVDTKCAGEQ